MYCYAIVNTGTGDIEHCWYTNGKKSEFTFGNKPPMRAYNPDPNDPEECIDKLSLPNYIALELSEEDVAEAFADLSIFRYPNDKEAVKGILNDPNALTAKDIREELRFDFPGGRPRIMARAEKAKIDIFGQIIEHGRNPNE